MALVVVSDKDFEEKIINSKLLTLVDFWAEWCAPCKLAAPVLDELSNEYKGKVMFAKVDVDQNPQSQGKYTILSIPTTVLLKDGKEIGRQVGFAGKKAFEDLIKKGL